VAFLFFGASMQDFQGSTEGALIVVKAASSSPAFIGILIAAAGFLFDWPKTAKEGMVRIAGHAICVVLFGDLLMYWIAGHVPMMPIEGIKIPAYLIAGLPGWYALVSIKAFFFYTKNSQRKSFTQLMTDIRKMVKK